LGETVFGSTRAIDLTLVLPFLATASEPASRYIDWRAFCARRAAEAAFAGGTDPLSASSSSSLSSLEAQATVAFVQNVSRAADPCVNSKVRKALLSLVLLAGASVRLGSEAARRRSRMGAFVKAFGSASIYGEPADPAMVRRRPG
jgi:hypothetical protein